jgi:hypothetical protein
MIGYGNSMFLGSTLLSGGGGSSFDPDAQAFITAAAITNPTQQAAINTLVVDLKGYSIWTKFSALYPFVGGTASTHKFNLKNPLDTNAAFRLLFSGGGTHSVNGYQTNGINAFAETNYNPSINLTSQNSNHISIYSRTNNQGGIDMGGGVGSVLVDLELNYATTSFNWNMAGNFSHTNSNSTGFYVNTRTASNAFKLLKNGSTVLGSSTGAAGATKPNITYHIGKRNYDPLWTNRQYAFASIGDGLTDTEAANFYTAVQAFQTTLGRSIGTQTVSDADAQAFVTNAGIVDQVEANAINNLVIGMKADGLWTKMKAVYPFVGGTAASHSYNLRNTAQYQITWNGGQTHDANGYTPGVNGYGNTWFATNLFTSANDFGLSTYLRTNTTIGADIGVFAPDLRYIGANLSNIAYFGVGNTFILNANTDAKGFWQVNRTSASLVKVFKNNSVFASGTTGAGTLGARTVFIGALNDNGNANFYTLRQHAFDAIHDGLTDAEATNLNSRVTTFQTALNRNI